MLLVIAATEFEMKPFLSLNNLDAGRVRTGISGVGLVESSVTVTRLLERYHEELSGVINFGIGGAYISEKGERQAEILELCLARKEFLGDYGVCIGSRTEPFSEGGIAGRMEFSLDQELFDFAAGILGRNGQAFSFGNFVTVNGASGTTERGLQLHRRFGGLCENMEGAAIARVCREFSVPMLEIRAISNMVEDRPGRPWRLKEACERSAAAACTIVTELLEVL